MLTATARSGNTDSIEQLGSRVRYARKRNGLTLKGLGDKVGCSESLLSKIERNHIVPSLPVLWRIAEALGTTFGALFSGKSMEPVTTYNDGERPLLSIGTGSGKMP